MEKIFEQIENHLGSQKAAAKWLCVAYSTYREWRYKGERLPERNKEYLKSKLRELDS